MKELNWWNEMTFENQFLKVIDWLSSQGRDTTEIHPHELTIRQVKEVYKRNHPTK